MHKLFYLLISCVFSFDTLFAQASLRIDPKIDKENYKAVLVKAEPLAKLSFEAKSGSKVNGSMVFIKKSYGFDVLAVVENLSPGLHGFHIHEYGNCSGKDAKSAGGHFNPGKTKHGHIEKGESHPGDFGNIFAGSDGRATFYLPYFKEEVGLKDINSIIGKSVVIHADPDDLSSQPSGNAGKRVACGIISKV